MKSILHEDHPSYGCDKAWFIFSDNKVGIVNRLILVEARNTFAVQTLEAIAASNDGMMNDTCELHMVIRNPESIGIRSDFVEGMDYVVFITEIVDASKIVSNSLVCAALQNSLPVGECNAATAELFSGIRNTPNKPEPKTVVDSHIYDNAMSALIGMGFSKLQAVNLINSVGPQANSMDLNSLIKQALKNNV